MEHMVRALELASRYRPHPNPRVGAVIVNERGQVIGEGAHVAPGTDHAEIVALNSVSADVAGSTIYVTLEPCSHHGRTPPCADALIAAGVSKVVVASIDPDTKVAGSGIARLAAAGIEVVTGVRADESEAMDPGYFLHRRLGRSRITLKMALTLDGNAAAADGTSQWITGDLAREDSHRLRSESDAVLVGAGTVIADDPLLEVRMVDGRQPRPVIVAGRTPLPVDARIWGRNPLVVAGAGYQGPGEHVLVATVGDGRVDVAAVARRLGELGLLDVMAEGGPHLARSLFTAGLVDRVVIYYGAKLAGGSGRNGFSGSFATLTDALDMHTRSVDLLGDDIRVELLPRGT